MNVDVEIYNDDGTLNQVRSYPVTRIDHHMVFVKEESGDEVLYCLSAKFPGQYYCGLDPRWRLSAKSLAECRAVADAVANGLQLLEAKSPVG